MSYWFEADDFDEFPEFYLILRRERLKGMELETYAHLGTLFYDMIQWMLKHHRVNYKRYMSTSTGTDYIYGRVCTEYEVFCMSMSEYIEKYGKGYPEYLV